MRNSILWVLFFTVFNFTNPARGMTPIQDPKRLIPRVRAFLGEKDFSQSFHCGDSSTLNAFRISCQEFVATETSLIEICTDSTDPLGVAVRRDVVACTEDQVSFYIDLTGESTDLTQADFLAAHSNAAELFLSDLPRFIGYDLAGLKISKVEESIYTLGRGTSVERIVPSINIFGILAEPGKMGLEFIVSVIRDAPGVAQIVRLRTGRKTWFLLQDFSRGSQ
jgi:hypothetical protein